MLYEQFYGFALSVCLRYASSREEATEMMNDGFVKVFQGIGTFKEPEDQQLLLKIFMAWLKKIMINTSINYSKAAATRSDHVLNYEEAGADGNDAKTAIDNLAYMDLIRLVQQLSPAYRNTFSLYAIEGYTHVQIARILGISVGASKSNLLKARKNLREMLEKIT